MAFNFSGNNLTGKDRILQRLFEIIPGLTSWVILVGMVVISFVKPLIGAIIVISFYLYWLLRLLYMTFFLVLSYFRLLSEKDTNWMERIQGLDNIKEYYPVLK